MPIISRLHLRHFRNYTSLRLRLVPGVNLLLGGNGQGKTNVLEAVSYLALLRSFRCRKVLPLRQWGTQAFYVAGTLQSGHGGGPDRDVAVVYGETRKASIGGKRVEKASEFINQFVCVPMVPEDVELVKGNALCRRRFLDIALSQCSPEYLTHLQRYTAALRNRNLILRERGRYPAATRSAYDDLVVRHGAWVALRRWEFVRDINPIVAALGSELLGQGAPPLSLKLNSGLYAGDLQMGSATAVAERFREVLARALPRDEAEGCTTVGPHRDDMSIHLGGRPLTDYGSEGQCRAASLVLRFACVELLHQGGDRQNEVVLLVDDVFGELDSRRRAAFFARVCSADQVLLTATQVPPEIAVRVAQTLMVYEGTVQASAGAEVKE